MAVLTYNGADSVSGFNILEYADFFDRGFLTEVWTELSHSATALIFSDEIETTTRVSFEGSGLTYGVNAADEVTGIRKGAITSMTHEILEGEVLTITGFNIAGKDFFKALDIGPKALIPLVFAGNDTFNGTFSADAFGGFGGNDSLDGGSGYDTLWGGNGNDTLLGGNQDDVLAGGKGKDVVTGGDGTDYFVFLEKPTAKDADRLTDFSTSDQILISNSWAGLSGEGALNDADIAFGTRATTRSQHFIYDEDTGRLFYDADGSKSKFDQVLIATLAPGADLGAGNIYLVDPQDYLLSLL